jgi:hypothetical protein
MESAMHVRLNTIFGEPDQAAAVVDYLEVLDRPAVEAAVGNGGLMTFMDQGGGVIVAASYWDQEARSCAAALTGVRHGAEVVARGMVVADSYEVRALLRLSVPRRGATVRLDRLQFESARIDEAAAFLGTVLIPELTCLAGLCSVEILVDADSSTGAALTVWDSEQAAGTGCTVLESLRDRVVDHGAKVVAVEDYTLISASPQPAQPRPCDS